MNPPPVFLKHVKEGLEILQDKKNQIRVWTGAHDYPLSEIETFCGLFDDSGLSLAIEKGEASAFLGEELTNLLIQIGDLVDRIDSSKDPVEIANLPEMKKIRRLAKQALGDPIFKSER